MDPDSQMTIPAVMPSGLEVDFEKNITKLYEAITACNWDAAIKACEKNPIEAKTWVVRHYDDDDGGGEKEIMWRFLPIHSACARQPPATVITALLNAYPDGARCVDDQGMYALHYACGNQASREVIRMLLMSFPEAAKLKDPRGMLPIHYLACWGPSSISVVDMVLVANRDVANAKDEDGSTPLQLAMEGEYAEREAVTAALRRWLENTSARQSKSIAMSPSREEKKEPEVTTTSRGMSNFQSSAPSHEYKTQQKLLKEMREKVKKLEMELRDGNSRIVELEQDLRAKDHALLNAEDHLREKTQLLEHTSEERDGLRQTLGDLTDQHDKHKKRSEILGDRFGSLNASLYTMMDQQTVVLDAMKAREEQWSAISDLRREKMKELVALEEQETTEEGELKSCLLKQTKEMEAIQAVIAAVRIAE